MVGDGGGGRVEVAAVNTVLNLLYHVTYSFQRDELILYSLSGFSTLC